MDTSKGNLLVTQVCEDVHSLYLKTEKLKEIWKTVEDTNMDLNNKIANLQKEISDLHQQLDKKTKSDIKSRQEVKDLKEKVEDLQDEIDALQEKLKIWEIFKVSPKTLARVKLTEFLCQIPCLMYKSMFPNADKKVYTIKKLKSLLAQKSLKQYDEMIAELELKDDFIESTIEDIMTTYQLNSIDLPTYKDRCEDIEAGITNMTDFEEIFKQIGIAQDDIKNCKLLAEAYLHLKTIIR